MTSTLKERRGKLSRTPVPTLNKAKNQPMRNKRKANTDNNPGKLLTLPRPKPLNLIMS